MFKASVIKKLAIKGYFLKVGAFAFYYSMQRFAVGQLHGPFWNQWGMQQIIALTCVGIKSHHVEGQPRTHGATIVVSWQSVRFVVVILADNLSDSIRSKVRSTNPMVETWCEERWLVAHVVALAIEEHIQSLAEGLSSATSLNQSWHIVR